MSFRWICLDAAGREGPLPLLDCHPV